MTARLLGRRLTAAFLSIGLALAALAPSVVPRAASAQGAGDLGDVARIEAYLNRLETVESRFVQVTDRGSLTEGDLHVKRPGKLRFEYDDPHPVLMIANGLQLVLYDKQVEQATFVPLWETPLWFLINEDVQLLSGDIEILGVERGLGLLKLRLRERENPEAGELAIVLTDRPMELKGWEVLDAQGITTEVTLVNPRFGVPIDNDVFDHRDYTGFPQ